jgi:hypothetical protein
MRFERAKLLIIGGKTAQLQFFNVFTEEVNADS